MKTITIILFSVILLYHPGMCQDEDLFSASKPSASVKDGNVVVTLDDGTERQLTFTQSDEKPVLVPSRNKVIFVRNEKVVQGEKEYFRKKIMTVGVNDFLEEEISTQKPYKDGKNNTTEILRIDNPAISSNGDYLFFLANHTATTSQVIKMEIATGKWNLLFSAESFEMLNTGPFRDYFLIGRQEVGASGLGMYYYLVDRTGKQVKEFNSKESMEQFKNSIR